MKKLLLALCLLPAAAQAQTGRQLENLYTFARLYGYVRYFHPSDAAAVTDWDQLAIYGARRAAEAKSPQQLKTALLELFGPIAPTLRLFRPGEKLRAAVEAPPGAAQMKPVYWQYLGYGGGANKYYSAKRTYSYMPGNNSDNGPGFGTIKTTLDARPFRGRQVRYSAAIKAIDLQSGNGHLWLRADRPGGKTGFFDGMGNRPLKGKNKPWQRFEISGRIDEDAENLVLGCMITGSGKMEVDEVRMEVQTAQGWQPVDIGNAGFENDTLLPWRSSTAPEWSATLTRQQPAGGQQALLLVHNRQTVNVVRTDSLFAAKLPAGTVIEKEIGSGLVCRLPLVLWGNGQQAWPLTDTAAALALNRKRADGAPQDVRDLYVRLGNVVIAWNILQHFHPYFREWATNWEEDLRTALRRCYGNKDTRDFTSTLETMIARLRDGHVHVYTSPPAPAKQLPLYWSWTGRELVVEKLVDASLPLAPGDVVTHINGQPARECIGAATAAQSAGTEEARWAYAAQRLLSGPPDSLLRLTIQAATGAPRQLSVPFTLEMPAAYENAPRNRDSLKQLEKDIMYVNLDQASWPLIKAQLPKLAGARAVIFDLRGYPKDENGKNIIRHLLTQGERNQWMQAPRITFPDHENVEWQGLGWQLQPAQPHIGGRTVFITGPFAISYAESVMGYIKDFGLATIVGETTSGTNGDANTFSLPGGYFVSFTGLKVTNHDGSQHYMKGITPDVTVHRTAAGIRAGRDEALEKALELLRQ